MKNVFSVAHCWETVANCWETNNNIQLTNYTSQMSISKQHVYNLSKNVSLPHPLKHLFDHCPI